MGEIVLENMTKNANAKVLSKEEIMAALMKDILRKSRSICLQEGLR